jgi:hypothetical protein
VTIFLDSSQYLDNVFQLQAIAWLAMSILGLIGHGECELWEQPKSGVNSFLIYVQQIYFQSNYKIILSILVEKFIYFMKM